MERRIVLITDSARDLSSADLGNVNMEGNSISASLATRDAISTFAPVTLYTELEDFRDNIKEHQHDLVFPMRYGPTSRTQKGLISSLCETYGIDYMGADNYTQLLCNDKKFFRKASFTNSSCPHEHDNLTMSHARANLIRYFFAFIRPIVELFVLIITTHNLCPFPLSEYIKIISK